METTPKLDDVSIGSKVRARRKLLGFGPYQFASLLGISHQQLHKYESGTNRISAAQLGKIAKILNVDIGHFMKDSLLPFQMPVNNSYRAAQVAEQPETTLLVKHYISISDPRVRTAVVELVTSITKYLAKKAS